MIKFIETRISSAGNIKGFKFCNESYKLSVGKTNTAIIAIKAILSKNKNIKTVVTVPTEYLKVQWIQSLAKNGLFQEVTVEVINSAAKKQEKVNFLILDECHREGSESFYEVFRNRDPDIVLGLSATFDRLDGRHELLNKFCPVCDTITVKEAIENGWLSPYREYKVLLEVDDIDVYKQANSEFQNSFSMLGYDFNLAMKCLTNIIYRRTYAKKMGWSAKDIDGIIFSWNRALKARKDFVMNHPKKIEIARKILNARQDKKGITFSATIKQAERIGIGYVVHSGNTKKKNKLTMEEFRDLKYGVINSSKSLIEGADIPGLNLAIILCGNSSSTAKTQSLGRVIRYEEGKQAEVFSLIIKGTMEENWHSTATQGKSYIEITESELDDILNNVEINVVEKEAAASDLIFRL